MTGQKVFNNFKKTLKPLGWLSLKHTCVFAWTNPYAVMLSDFEKYKNILSATDPDFKENPDKI